MTTMPGRLAARLELGELIANNLVGVGKIAQSMFSYQASDFRGHSPVIVVTSAGIGRERSEYADYDSVAVLDVHLFTLYAEQGTDYDEAEAEDIADQLEQAVAQLIADHTHGTAWGDLWIEGETALDALLLNGAEYKHEVMRVKARLL